MIWKQVIGRELYVYHNGQLIYKRWLDSGRSLVFEVSGYPWNPGRGTMPVINNESYLPDVTKRAVTDPWVSIPQADTLPMNPDDDLTLINPDADILRGLDEQKQCDRRRAKAAEKLKSILEDVFNLGYDAGANEKGDYDCAKEPTMSLATIAVESVLRDFERGE